jgi:Tfp pilus assembly protein FimT
LLGILEMLVVFFIVSILTLLALPTLLSYNQEQRVTLYTQNLYYALELARSEAVKRNTTVYVSFQTTDNWCYGINPGSICNCSVTNNCAIKTAVAPRLQDLTLTATGLTTNALSFEPTHGAAGAKSVITFTAFNQTPAMSVEVPVMGSALMCSSNISGYPVCP